MSLVVILLWICSYHCQHIKLLATGHSLGGALATLHILDARINTAFAQYGLYTFASPKVGDIAFRNYYKLQVASSFRFVNLFDVVPLLPPRNINFNNHDWEYAHVHHNMTFTKTQNPLQIIIPLQHTKHV